MSEKLRSSSSAVRRPAAMPSICLPPLRRTLAGVTARDITVLDFWCRLHRNARCPPLALAGIVGASIFVGCGDALRAFVSGLLAFVLLLHGSAQAAGEDSDKPEVKHLTIAALGDSL